MCFLLQFSSIFLFIAIFLKMLSMILEYKKKKSNRPDGIVYLVSSSNRPRNSRIDEGRFIMSQASSTRMTPTVGGHRAMIWFL